MAENLVYRGHPLRRVENLVYYGSMADKYMRLARSGSSRCGTATAAWVDAVVSAAVSAALTGASAPSGAPRRG